MSNFSKNENNEKISINSNYNITEIKSKYILKKIFYNIKEYKYLKIIKYNKKLQNRLNISINDYKKLLQLELEIIPVKNKKGNFININNKEEEKYYQIFFNDDKIPKKRYYIHKKDKITKIKIIIDYQIQSFNEIFNFSDCIESITFIKFNPNNINNMNSMFYECSSLKEINFNKFNTSNVTNMSYMFYGCSSLKELNFDNFNINHDVYLKGMFH